MGSAVDWVAAAALVALGGWMLFHEEESEGDRSPSLEHAAASPCSHLESRSASTNWRWASRSDRSYRLIKQIVTMLLATSPIELSDEYPELGDFVLARLERN